MRAQGLEKSTLHKQGPSGPAIDPMNQGTAKASPIQLFLKRLEEALRLDTFVRLVLSGPRAEVSPLEKITARLVILPDEPVLSITQREARRDTTRNLKLGEVEGWILGELDGRFRRALLETTSADWQFSQADEGRGARIIRHSPRSRVPPSRDHDHAKNRALDATAHDWLRGLGLLDDTGTPPPSRTAKHQQIQRYAEILEHLVRDCGWTAGSPLRLADMGCGRGYLTFAAWQLLHRQLGFAATVTGVEVREELVRAGRELVTRLGLHGLEFNAGTVAATSVQPLDILIALHACNTATDDAIRHGIASGCRLIVVAPCCHQEVRPQLVAPEPFAGAMQQGLIAERFAEWITDVLRVHFLEWAGYRVKTVEFVAPEHTPKNLLIAGIKAGEPFTDLLARDRIVALKSMFSLGHHALDPLLTP